ncbi:MAG: succinate--CoA ligase subunit alpha [Candidatus Pacebacteria bacterium]|nr:succinate--CoA ligase subunit alpha [Candidatus Paceibacterota bacterium]
MSILVDKTSRVLVQGITGSEGSFWTHHMLGMGTQLAAGVTPGKEGREVDGVPVFNSVRKAVRETDANASVLFVPPRFSKDAVFEALDAGIRTIVVIAEGIPVQDALEMRRAAHSSGATVVGGNTSGVITPGESMMGIFPYWIKRVYTPGRIGVMTRSGSLTNEVTAMLIKGGFGVSTLAGVGGDQAPCSRFAEILTLFEQDPATDAVLLIGELGGTMEEEVAEMLANGRCSKPVGAFIAGRSAPPGKAMGHAGAIVAEGKGTAAGKIACLRDAGAEVAERPSQVGDVFRKLLAITG